jgi:hypothetical protein
VSNVGPEGFRAITQSQSLPNLRLGANHQTGWTERSARTLHLFATTNAEQVP